MTTLDFEVEIGPGAAGSYPVVARAPGGDAATTLRWSLSPAELDHQLAVVKDKVLVSSAVTRRAPTQDEQPVRQLGQRLFEALIADDVRALYVASRQRAREEDCVLRLVLRVRPPELARLPWEFLFDPGQQDYLGLTVPLVRYLQVLAPRHPLRVAAPLRILGMVARPGDQHALDTWDEQQRLQVALASLQREGLVELEWVAGQTYRDLEDALDRGPWHVFHFAGHGGYDRVADEGVLAMADETGRTHPVGADDVSRLLAEHYPLRLVVLNACDTGRGSASDAFSSTAAALIRREIPAVVAMQFEITDSAAIRFAQNFYEYVAKRQPVDESVMRARRALRLAKKDTLEWGTPVLYLRAPDGRIFDDPIPLPPHRPDPPAPLSSVHRDFCHTHASWPTTRVNAVAFSPNGRQLATASADTTARVWHATKGVELVKITHESEVGGVVFSPDGRLLATASGDGTAWVWDASGGSELARVTHPVTDKVSIRLFANSRIADGASFHFRLAKQRWAAAVVFSPDGHRLATAFGVDVTARVWDVSSGKELARVTHENNVYGVAFSPDGCRLATASADRTARVWDVNSWQELARATENNYAFLYCT